MKKGVILINSYYDLPSYLNQAYRIKEELSALGVSADILKSSELDVSVKDGKTVTGAEGYDFCVYLDKDKYISNALEKQGMRLFNTHSSVLACDDKMTTYLTLADNGIPIPDTLSGLLCYRPEKQVAKATLDKIENSFGYPLIAKESFGSLGKGVYKIDDRNRLEKIAEKLKLRPHLFQRYVSTSYGTDIRITVIGGKVVAAMRRRSDGDFRSNLELGGTGEKITPDDRLISLSEKVALVLGLDYCGIDWLFGENGDYVLCEVNSNAFFGGTERVTGVNIGREYAKHIISTVYSV